LSSSFLIRSATTSCFLAFNDTTRFSFPNSATRFQ
jgi:hypothetical protein